MTTSKVLTYDEVYNKLLETDKDDNYFEPLIAPTWQLIEFAWANYSIWILPDGTWKAAANK